MVDSQAIPLMHRRICSHCGIVVDTRSPSVRRLIQGWIPCGRTKGRTGMNTIVTEKDLDSYLCHECLYKKKHGIHPDQASIFDELND